MEGTWHNLEVWQRGGEARNNFETHVTILVRYIENMIFEV
jgi:hypothetical protein